MTNDAPKTIWLLDTFTASEGVAKEPSRFSLKETMWHHDDIVQARIDELEEHVSDLLVDLPCACGHDNPTDICMGHMPAFRKAQARIAELERRDDAQCFAIDNMTNRSAVDMQTIDELTEALEFVRDHSFTGSSPHVRAVKALEKKL
jgi:hypothetical protein